MYINKLDDIFDKTINNFYNFLIEKKSFEHLRKDLNFVSYQNYILNLIKEFIDNKINKKEIESVVATKSNYENIIEIIKRYLAYYVYLSIAYMYESGRDLYATNIIESSKNQKDGTFRIENFFNSENNSKLISFFNDIKNLLTVIKLGKNIDQIKIILGNNPIKFDSTINLINKLGEDYIIEFILIKNNMHNVIKTIIFKLIYFIEEKSDIVRILKQEEENEGEFKYIEVVYSKESKLVDFTLIQKFLNIDQIKSGLAEEIYDYLDFARKEKEFSIKEDKDFVNYLLTNEILIPITEEFLRYHKDSEKYDSESLVNESDIKERDATKIKYIINKMNKIRNVNSKVYEKNPKLKLDAMKLYYKPLDFKEAVLFNENEEIKIVQKLEDSEKTSDLDLLGDLENIRKYAYVNYKDFSKDGFKFRPDKPTQCIRYTNIKNSKTKNKKIETRVGNDNIDINIIGLAWNPSKLPIDCFSKDDIVNVNNILKSENGFKSFDKVVKSTFNKDNKKKLFYWLFNIEKDLPDLDDYINLSKQNVSASIFTLISEIYKTYYSSVENKLLNDIDKFKELNNFQIENIIKKHNKLINEDFDISLKNKILNYTLMNKLIDKEVTDDETENFIPGKSGDIIKLPELKINKFKENIITISDEDDFEFNLDKDEINPICHHYVKWKEINRLAKQKDDVFSQSVFNFVKKYVRENENAEFICKSCNEVLNLKKYVFDGTYVAELDTFLTTSLAVGQDLKKIPKYAKYTRTIRNIEKNVEKFAFIVNLNNYLGSSAVIKLRRKMVVKDSIDLILIHTDYLKNQPKDRITNFSKKYGINPDLTNLFFFELKDEIFLTSSKDTDYYKLIKYNNVLSYILFIIITELSPGQILGLKDDKRCNFFLFNKLKDSIFGNLYIRINQKEKIPATKVPLFCYVTYYFSCIMVSNFIWLWNVKEKEKFNPIIQSTIIHTLFDLVNSVFEANFYLEGENKNFLYEIISTRLSEKLKYLFNDKDLLNRIEEESNKKIRIDKDTKKISYVSKKVNYIDIDSNNELNEVELLKYKSECEASLKSLELKPKKIYHNELNVTTNCPDGKFHLWSIQDNDLVCSLCNQKYNKLVNTVTSTEEDYQNVIDQLKQEQYKTLLKEYCISGELHEIEKDNICSKCKINPLEHKYTQKEINQFEKNMNENTNLKQINNINKTKEYIKKIEEENTKSKKIIKKFNKRYQGHTKNKLINYLDDFIDELIKILSKKIKLKDKEIYLKETYYYIDHDYLGTQSKNGFRILSSENKVLIEKNNKDFNKDVYFYKDRSKNITVFYDAITLQYLGYSENNKVYKQKSYSFLKIFYSTRDQLRYMGLSNNYFNIDNLKGKYEEIPNNQIIERLMRLKINNLKQIISRTNSIIYRIKNNLRETSVYGSSQKDIINNFIKTIKKFNVKNESKSKSIFKHLKYISNRNIIDKIPENIKLEFNENFIQTEVLESFNNLDSKLLFYMIYNFNRLLEYNNKSNSKSTLALLIVRLIEFNFDQYFIPYHNFEVRKLETIINIDAPNVDDSLRIISSFEELYNNQEIDDVYGNMTEEEVKEMQYDMQEQFDALDLDGYGDGDTDDEDAYMPESEMD